MLLVAAAAVRSFFMATTWTQSRAVDNQKNDLLHRFHWTGKKLWSLLGTGYKISRHRLIFEGICPTCHSNEIPPLTEPVLVRPPAQQIPLRPVPAFTEKKKSSRKKWLWKQKSLSWQSSSKTPFPFTHGIPTWTPLSHRLAESNLSGLSLKVALSDIKGSKNDAASPDSLPT